MRINSTDLFAQMASSSIGTAWIQIKPSLSGISKDIEKSLGDSGSDASKRFAANFKSNFLTGVKQSFSEAFSEFGRRSDAAFAQFKTAAKVGFAVAGAGVVGLAMQLDAASGSQQAFIANMKLAGRTNEETAKTFSLLEDYANKSIYSLSEMTATAGILASSGVKNAGELVRAFGNLAAAGENPAQAIRSISQQMSQVNGKGFVQTMDFRIMQEQAAGPMKLVRDRLMELNSWNPAGFQDALSKGEISAKMLNDVMLEVGNNPMLTELATKPRTIADAWTVLTSTLVSNLAKSKSWEEVQKRVIDWLVQGAEWVDRNKEAIEAWVKELVDSIASIAKWVGENKDLLLTIGKVILVLKTLQIVVGGVRAAIALFSPVTSIAVGTFQLMAAVANSSFVSIGVQALLTGAKIAAAWLIGMGPIGWIIAAVAGLAILIIANWDMVKGWLLGFWEWIQSAASDAWQGIKNVFGGIGKWFSDTFESVKSVFSSFGGKIGEIVGNAFRTAINGAIWAVESYLNIPINLINAALDKINALPGVEIGLIPNLKLPRFATGGAVFGAGGPTSDSIPAMLSDGEYVIKAAAAQKIGYNNLDQLNSTGKMGGDTYDVDISINGYNKDPKELANEISRIIALQRARVVGG